MKIFPSVLGALALCIPFIVPAGAHPHNHGNAPVMTAPKLIQLDAEEVMSFDNGGATYSLWNTHQRGLFGLELIEVRGESGAAVAGWWSSRGWCFTAKAYAANACWSSARMAGFAGAKLVNASYSRSPSTRAGGSATEASTDFCDHYSALEAKISEATSGRCGY